MSPEEVRAGNIGCDLLSSAIGRPVPEDEDVEIDEQEIRFLRVLGCVALVGLVFVLAAAILLPSAWMITRSLGLALGEAFVVAAVLGFTVDRYLKEFLVRKASLELSKFLVGYKLPETIQNRLRALMGTSLIRERYRTTYTLTPLPDNQVLIDVKYQFDLKNISLSVESFVPRLELEKHDNPSILELRCDGETANFQKLAGTSGTIGTESVAVPGVIEAIGDNIDLQPEKVYPIIESRII